MSRETVSATLLIYIFVADALLLNVLVITIKYHVLGDKAVLPLHTTLSGLAWPVLSPIWKVILSLKSFTTKYPE